MLHFFIIYFFADFKRFSTKIDKSRFLSLYHWIQIGKYTNNNHYYFHDKYKKKLIILFSFLHFFMMKVAKHANNVDNIAQNNLAKEAWNKNYIDWMVKRENQKVINHFSLIFFAFFSFFGKLKCCSIDNFFEIFLWGI